MRSAVEREAGAAPRVFVPAEITEAAIESIGRYFEPLCGIDKVVLGSDHVDAKRYRRNIEALNDEVPLAGRKLLEIGSGFGVSLAVMVKEFGVDAYGVEPASDGFNASLTCARVLLEANGLDSARVIDAVGEKLPFPDASFDAVYSNNVLEHTADPAAVLREAFRVLKPGGRMFLEVPNYLSFYEGHYLVAQPPILWNGLLASWVKWVFKRDPAFARTLRTEINPVWLRRTLRHIAHTYPHCVETMGEERFLLRMAKPFVFQTDAVKGNAARAIALLQRLNGLNWIGHLIVALRAHYPIVLVATPAARTVVVGSMMSLPPIGARSRGPEVASLSTPRRCPVCDDDRAESLFENRMAPIAGIDFGYEVVACRSCKMVYASRTPDDATLARYYRDFSKYDQPRSVDELDAGDLHRADVAATFARRVLPAGARVLDVGCSIGLFLGSLARSDSFVVEGLDPSPTSGRVARELFGIEVHAGDACTFDRFDAFDGIALLAVIEHLRNPGTLFRTLSRSMKPGATLIIEVPNADEFGAYPAIGRVSEPFGEFSNEHINFFGEATLRKLAERFGFSWIASEELPYLAGVTGMLSAFRKGGRPVAPTAVEGSHASVSRYVARSAAAMGAVASRLTEALHGEQKVVLYGAGSHSARMLAQGGLGRFPIECVVDRNRHLTGQTIGDLPIVLPEILTRLPRSPVVVSSFHAMSAIAGYLEKDFDHRVVTLYPRKPFVSTRSSLTDRTTQRSRPDVHHNSIPSA